MESRKPYTEIDLLALAEMLDQKQGLTKHTSWKTNRDRMILCLNGKKPEDALRKFVRKRYDRYFHRIFTSILIMASMRDLPPHLNDQSDIRVFALWRMKIGK